jgi:hypothetical protein
VLYRFFLVGLGFQALSAAACLFLSLKLPREFPLRLAPVGPGLAIKPVTILVFDRR